MRLMLVVVVLAFAMAGCSAREERVYDDTTLRLNTYTPPRYGEILLEWTGGPEGAKHWEYHMRGPGFPPPGVWRDVPADRASGQRLRITVEPGTGYLFMIRERGDPRDPWETNPGAVAGGEAAEDREDGYAFYSKWLEPGERYRLESHGVHVTAPPEGRMEVLSSCDGYGLALRLQLPTNDGGMVDVYTGLMLVPPRLIEDAKAKVNDPYVGAPLRLLLSEGPLEDGWGPPAREAAEHHADPNVRKAYGLLADVLVSILGYYPPPGPGDDTFSDPFCHS